MSPDEQSAGQPLRRQTMIAPQDDRELASKTHTFGERRRTLIEDESPGKLVSAFDVKSTSENQAEARAAKRFKPQTRPPMAKLFVLDDSGTDAEIIRIREDRFRIGRASGDLVVGHDGQMSGEHAEIRREYHDGAWQWQLVDLDSTNGLFVRATEVPLEDQQEFWLGGRLYRFIVGEIEPSQLTEVKGTLVAGGGSLGPAPTASIVEVTAGGDGASYPLSGLQRHWIGRDPSKCNIVINDPMLGNQEAMVFVDEHRKWGIKKGNSLNGIWARVSAVPLVGLGMQFQCGEQRFALRLD